MPKSRAAVIGLGFAAQSKGGAAKMFADPTNWGRKPRTRSMKRCSARANRSPVFDSIASSIKPEHPDLRGSP